MGLQTIGMRSEVPLEGLGQREKEIAQVGIIQNATWLAHAVESLLKLTWCKSNKQRATTTITPRQHFIGHSLSSLRI